MFTEIKNSQNSRNKLQEQQNEFEKKNSWNGICKKSNRIESDQVDKFGESMKIDSSRLGKIKVGELCLRIKKTSDPSHIF